MQKQNTMKALLGLTLADLQALCKERNYPGYTARQLAEWLYKKQVTEIDAMTNLSVAVRKALSESYHVGRSAPENVMVSTDGTKKYLFPAGTTHCVESAWIPSPNRNTLCISSQVGCRMGCSFCMTARQGFQKHLPAGEIINQISSLPERDGLTNVVYMGMGEPLDNPDAVMKSLEILTADWGFGWSPSRITVSTIGVIPALSRFLRESRCHLAISLHSPFSEERRALMPMQKAYPLEELIPILRSFDFGLQRRVSFEYILFGGVNDSPRHAKALANLIKGMNARVNLIHFHPIPNSPLVPAQEKEMLAFQKTLSENRIIATIRSSRGLDIMAACGMLSTKHALKQD